MGSANTLNLFPFLGLTVQSFMRRLQCRNELVPDGQRCCDMYGGGRLPDIDLIIWMDRIFGSNRLPQFLSHVIGDYLVGVDVGTGARSGLIDIHHEVMIDRPFCDLVGPT